jgi:CBS domain-containing protein
MPFIIHNLIPELQNLITVTESDAGQLALSLMIEHDFSQLPVIDSENTLKGMITSDSILRAVSYFKVTPDSLKVSHATIKTAACRIDDDLSELLKELRYINAIPIVDRQNKLKGIVTSYDTAEYFRRRAEDIMLAEDIETTLRDFIESSYRNEAGEVDEEALGQAIQDITPSSKELKSKFKSALFSYIGKTSNSKPIPNETIFNEVFVKYLDQPIVPKLFEELTLYECNRPRKLNNT